MIVNEMKDKMKKEYYRRVRKVFERMKGKNGGHKNNYMDNLSDKKCEASEDWWRWLRRKCLKRTSEALIMANRNRL